MKFDIFTVKFPPSPFDTFAITSLMSSGWKKIKFWKVKIIDEKFDEKPGTVIMADEKKGLIISTLDGAISVLEIQGENARKMPFSDYLRGNKILSGDIFK